MHCKPLVLKGSGREDLVSNQPSILLENNKIVECIKTIYKSANK